MTMTTPETHVIGSTLYMAGQVRIGGTNPNLSGWSVSATLRGKGFVHAMACGLEWLEDEGHTLVTLRADADEQAAWRAGSATLDVRLTAPGGYQIISLPARLLLLKS